MTCKSCRSENQRKFVSEINVHFSGLKNLNKPSIFVFPNLQVCMDCGFTEFAMPESELRLLANEGVAYGKTTTPTRPERAAAAACAAG